MLIIMTEKAKQNKTVPNIPLGASGNAPTRESVNAPSRQFNGSQDVPTTSSKGKQVSSKTTAND